MARRQLRVYSATEPADLPPATAEVRVRLSELLPLIALAQRQHFIWLRDFLDDEVRVTTDLYEVRQAFRACRPSAGLCGRCPAEASFGERFAEPSLNYIP